MIYDDFFYPTLKVTCSNNDRNREDRGSWVQRSEGEKSYKRKKRTGMNSCALVRSCSQVILQTSPIQNAQPQHTSNISKPLKSPSHFSSIFFNHSTFLIKLIHTSLTLDSYWFLKITPFVFSPLLFSKLLDAINFCCDRKIKEVEFIRAWNKDLLFNQWLNTDFLNFFLF